MTDHTMKTLESKYPGKMAVADVRGTYSGCTVKLWDELNPNKLQDSINDFFAENEGLLVVDMKFWANATPEGIHHMAAITFTAQVDDEYLHAIARFGEEIQKKLAEEKAAQLEAQAAAEEKVEEAQKTVAELAEIGRKCVHNHSGLVEENRKLKKKVGKK